MYKLLIYLYALAIEDKTKNTYSFLKEEMNRAVHNFFKTAILVCKWLFVWMICLIYGLLIGQAILDHMAEPIKPIDPEPISEPEFQAPKPFDGYLP